MPGTEGTQVGAWGAQNHPPEAQSSVYRWIHECTITNSTVKAPELKAWRVRLTYGQKGDRTWQVDESGSLPRRNDLRLQSQRKDRHNLVEERGPELPGEGTRICIGKGVRRKHGTGTDFLCDLSIPSHCFRLPIYLIASEMMQPSGVLGNLESHLIS